MKKSDAVELVNKAYTVIQKTRSNIMETTEDASIEARKFRAQHSR